MSMRDADLRRENERPSVAPDRVDVVTLAVEAKGLVKHFSGRGGEVEAVRGVDLRVREGEIFGFLGPNGAGKSTTVRMLTTLMTLTAGSARVGGVDVTEDPDGARQRIGVALQEVGLDPRGVTRQGPLTRDPGEGGGDGRAGGDGVKT